MVPQTPEGGNAARMMIVFLVEPDAANEVVVHTERHMCYPGADLTTMHDSLHKTYEIDYELMRRLIITS